MRQLMMDFLGLRSRVRYSTLFCLISAIDFFPFSYSQEVSTCNDPTASPNASCWEALQIPAWLSQFSGSDSRCATSNNATVTDSRSSWGACFILIINDGDEGQEVSQEISILDSYMSADSLDQAALQMTPSADRPRYVYALRALSRLSEFFDSWNNDVSSYVIASGIDVPAILATLDLDTQTSYPSDALYRALLLGLPFSIAYNGTFFPAFNSFGIPPEISLDDVGGLLLELVQLATVPLSDLPPPTNVSSVVGASAVPSALLGLSETLSSRVQDGLQAFTSNLDIFLNATANGTFASAQDWMIPRGPAILLQPLDTFLVSSILAQNNWIILALVGIDVAALSQTSTGTLPAWVLSNCKTCTPPVNFGCTSYDSNNQCGRWWYSADLNSSFTLVQPGNLSNDPTSLIATVFQQGWTTGELLFENAAICDEPSSLVETVGGMQTLQRPAAPVTDYVDSWFWRLMGTASQAGTASVDIVVSDAFNVYIESRPGPVSHPSDTLFNITDGKVDFACISQLDLQVGWNWSGIVAGDFS